jgi:hypothetical protein
MTATVIAAVGVGTCLAGFVQQPRHAPTLAGVRVYRRLLLLAAGLTMLLSLVSAFTTRRG